MMQYKKGDIKMKKRLILMMALTLVLSVIVAGCGGGGAASKPDSLSIATGGTSGTYYPLGGGMAQIFTDKVINTTAESTGASVENMQLIKNGDVDLAFTQGDIADYASKGAIMFEQGGKIENLQAIASLYNETIQIIVPKDSAIQTVEDLKGKRVSIGAPGSGTEANAIQILEVYGMTPEDLGEVQRLSFGDSSAYIQDGTLDAAFVTSGTPTSAVSELAATVGVRIVSLDGDHIAQLIEKYPYYAEQGIEAGTYSGFDEAVTTVAVKAQLVVRADLDEEIVYNLTKALFENLEQLKTVHKKAEQIKLETALEGVSLELHPGAAKYYKEAGLK
jgi:TRAP transporter TAXI family solute receptor